MTSCFTYVFWFSNKSCGNAKIRAREMLNDFARRLHKIFSMTPLATIFRHAELDSASPISMSFDHHPQ